MEQDPKAEENRPISNQRVRNEGGVEASKPSTGLSADHLDGRSVKRRNTNGSNSLESDPPVKGIVVEKGNLGYR